jgi:hypothetical protein
MDMVQEHLGGDGVAQLTQHLGVDQGTAQAAAAAALPMLVNAMSSRMSSSGAASMPSAGAGDLGGAAGGLLGNLLGGNHAEMSQQVSKHSGLDVHQAEKALLFLAPIVMAQLAKKRQQAAPTAGPAAGATPTAEPDTKPGGLSGVIDAVERIFHKGS